MSNFVRLPSIPGAFKICKSKGLVVRSNLWAYIQRHLKMPNDFIRPWIISTEHKKDGLGYVVSHINLEPYDILCPFSGRRLVLLVILVKVLSNLWRRPLHENPLLYKPSTGLWRRHLPGTAHRGSTLQHTALSRYGRPARAALLFVCHRIKHSQLGNIMLLDLLCRSIIKCTISSYMLQSQ